MLQKPSATDLYDDVNTSMFYAAFYAHLLKQLAVKSESQACVNHMQSGY